MKYFISLLFFITLNGYAQVYEQQDQQGNTTYSDLPLQASKEVSAQSSSTNTSTITSTNTTSSLPIKKLTVENKNHLYNTFSITTPKNQETIQNQPLIPVKLKLDPKLQEGDRIQLMLDGKPWGNPEANNEINMSLVDRGTHQLSAVIFDKNQTVIKQSETITIYVHHASKLNKPS